MCERNLFAGRAEGGAYDTLTGDKNTLGPPWIARKKSKRVTYSSGSYVALNIGTKRGLPESLARGKVYTCRKSDEVSSSSKITATISDVVGKSPRKQAMSCPIDRHETNLYVKDVQITANDFVHGMLIRSYHTAVPRVTPRQSTLIRRSKRTFVPRQLRV